MKTIIACDVHDYFEIACMRRLAVQLLLHSGVSIEGLASDLITTEGREFLVIELPDRQSTQNEVINLMDIKTLTLLSESKVIPVSSRSPVS